MGRKGKGKSQRRGGEKRQQRRERKREEKRAEQGTTKPGRRKKKRNREKRKQIPNSNKRAPKNKKHKKNKLKKQQKKDPGSRKDRPKKELHGHEVSILQPVSPWQIIYGRNRIGGTFIFLHAEPSNDRRFYFVDALAGHPIDAVEKIYANDVEVVRGGPLPDNRWADNTGPFSVKNSPKFFMEFGLSGGWQNDLAMALPTYWDGTHKLTDIAHAVGILIYHKKVKEYIEGMPEFSYDVRGKQVYDPRTTGTAYSNNVALCALDYLTDTRYGIGAVWPDEFDTQNWEDAADVCDELVSLAAGGDEKRYTCNLVFNSTERHETVLDWFEGAMAGSITYWNAKWRCFPGKYRTPTETIDEDDIRGTSVNIVTRQRTDDIFNTVRATYISEENEWKETELPSITNATYVSEDGKVIYEDIAFPGVTSFAQAQRLMKIELERIRQGIEVELEVYLAGYLFQPEDVVQLTINRLGWVQKPFVVTDAVLFMNVNRDDPYFTIKLSLRETSSVVYAWSTEENAIDIAPNTTLPSPDDLTAPVALSLESGTEHLEKLADGSINSRIKVSWNLVEDPFTADGGYIEVQFRRDGGNWIDITDVPGDSTFTYVNHIIEGSTYDVRVRARNYMGFLSDYTEETGHIAIGKSAPPSDVLIFTGIATINGNKLSWTEITDLDVDHYQIRRGESWDTSIIVANVAGDTYTDLFFDLDVTYWIKAVDTSGNFSTNAKDTDVQADAPGPILNLSVDVIDNNALFRWDPPVTGSYPVADYRIYKGMTASPANFIGTVKGTFFSYLQQSSETVMFWFAAVDTGGNEGPAVSKEVTIFEPPDFVLLDSGSPDLAATGTYVNAFQWDGSPDAFIAPYLTGRTFAQHFTDNSYTTFQDFIDNGYTVYSEPAYTVADGYYEFEIDLGVVISSSRVGLNYTVEQLGSGTATVSPTISYKTLIGDPWTDVSASETTAVNFQFLKFRMTAASGGSDKALARVSNIQYRVDTKKATDRGNGTSSAVAATTVNFNLDFLDVQSINVTVQDAGTDGYVAVVDFNDVPNPTSFDVYVFVARNGNQVVKDFYWTAVGTLTPP